MWPKATPVAPSPFPSFTNLWKEVIRGIRPAIPPSQKGLSPSRGGNGVFKMSEQKQKRPERKGDGNWALGLIMNRQQVCDS